MAYETPCDLVPVASPSPSGPALLHYHSAALASFPKDFSLSETFVLAVSSLVSLYITLFCFLYSTYIYLKVYYLLNSWGCVCVCIICLH
jgi:small neutral amino acid transporter SnatA (MarC family)